MWDPCFRAAGIGWTLHRQGRDWLESANYREVEAPLDSCWLLDAMIGGGGRTIAGMGLTRPRSGRPFTVDDVQRLDPLRPWLAHAFLRPSSGDAPHEDQSPIVTAGPTVRSGHLIATPNSRLVHQSTGLQFLLRILAGEPANYTRYVPIRERLPAPILKLIRQIAGAANGTSNAPPRTQVSTAYGVLTLEAKWLVPAGTLRKMPPGSEKLSHRGDDRTPRTPHCPCRSRSAGKRRHAGADESRHSPCPWQDEAGDRG